MKITLAILLQMLLWHGSTWAENENRGYQGLGVESVKPEILEKYAPKPVARELRAKLQMALDIRAPNLGVLAPSGKELFFSWRVTGVPQVWKQSGPDGFPEQLTGGEDVTLVEDIAPNGKFIVVSRDQSGGENFELYWQATTGGPLHEILKKDKVRAEFGFISDDSRWVYFGANDAKPNSFALSRYDMQNGKIERFFSQDGTWWIEDYRGTEELLLAKATGSLSREIYLYNLRTQQLTPLLGQGESVPYRVRFAARPGEYLVRTNKLGEFHRIYLLKNDLLQAVTPEMPMDVEKFAIDRAQKTLYYTVNDQGRSRLNALNGKNFKPLALPKLPADAEQVVLGSVSRDGRYVTLGVERATAPQTNYVYDWESQKLTPWGKPAMPEADPGQFVTTQIESYPARDTSRIPMLVQRPPQCKEGEKLCPILVNLHGGPEWQHKPQFSALAQLFVAQGYVLVSPNVRGSEGYGKTYLAADDGPKRLNVITDIEDCSKYLRSRWSVGGKAPPLGVFGISYGGYSTLYAMTRFAGAFDAGVAIVGPSNLLSFLENTAPYRRALRISEYGDPVKDREALIKLSPINYVKQAKDPILIIQGVSDPRVPVGESIQMHQQLEKAGVKSQLILLADEGHGAAKRDNLVLQFGHLLQFFNAHLKN